jgi:hypothetical protein
MKLWILAAMFLAGLGVVIGNRMSVEAIGVVVGVVLGVAASIPVTLLVMLFLNQKDKTGDAERRADPPQVLIVDGRNIPHESQNIAETYFAGGRWREIPRKELN